MSMTPGFVAVLGCAIACVTVAVVMCVVVVVYNGLVARQAWCAQAWAQLRAALERRRRADLELAEPVSGSDAGDGESIAPPRTMPASADRLLQAAIRDYDATVREFERWQRTFPANLMVRLLGVRPPMPFEAAAGNARHLSPGSRRGQEWPADLVAAGDGTSARRGC